MPLQFTDGRALIIGIANYEHINILPETVLNDARDIAGVFRSADYCGYPLAQTELLLDQQASGERIRAELRKLAADVCPNDTVVIFFSGHGGRIESGARAGSYLIPFDCNPSRLTDTAIGSAELTSLFSAIKSKRLVILMDACHSAGAGDVKALAQIGELKTGFDDKTYEALSRGAGRVIMASSRPDEVSLVLPGMNNSLFTHYLLDALMGNASAAGDDVVKVFEVFNYISANVPTRANQHPVFKAQDLETDFPLALRHRGKTLTPNMTPRPSKISGIDRLRIIKGLVERWRDLALYFEIPPSDRATFMTGHEPGAVLDWLEERGRLAGLRQAFIDLEYTDLLAFLDH